MPRPVDSRSPRCTFRRTLRIGVQFARPSRYNLVARGSGAISKAVRERETIRMDIFEYREKGFEQKYKHDQELEFKIKVRANKLLGLWVAGELGLPAGAADASA